MAKKLHLALFGATGPENWLSDSAALYDWRKPDLVRDVARLAERAKLDLMLFADGLAMPTRYRNTLQYAAETGTGVGPDSLLVVTALSAVTSHIGLGATTSTTFTPPVVAARQYSSLDHLSGGRAAWNVVTSTDTGAARLCGVPFPDHDVRYDMADEHLRICRGLWDSWAPDAVVEDRENRIFADYTKIRPVDFEGKYYRCHGPLSVTSSPQRRPIIIMAGTSPRGLKFAVDNADMVISHKNTVKDMATYSRQLRTQLEAAGRDPYSCKIFFAIRPWLGATEAEAKEKMERNKARVRMEDGLAYLSMNLGMDLSEADLDAPLNPDMAVNAMIGKLLQYTQALGGMTIREIGLHEAQRETFPMWGTPEQIADRIEEVAAESDADGFHFRYTMQDFNYVVDITTKLIPLLQARGLFRKEYKGCTLREHLFGPQE
jgi:FMN-dependent oxidoreductase (nitrilotriacetate monooxygenase family)